MPYYHQLSEFGRRVGSKDKIKRKSRLGYVAKGALIGTGVGVGVPGIRAATYSPLLRDVYRSHLASGMSVKQAKRAMALGIGLGIASNAGQYALLGAASGAAIKSYKDSKARADYLNKNYKIVKK